MNAVIREGTYENYLLVEGMEDKQVFIHLLKHYKIFDIFKSKREIFEIKEHLGIDNLLSLRTLRTYLKVDEARRYGIVVDADDNLQARWQQLIDILKVVGYTSLANVPESTGTILKQAGLPVVGIWLMPNNRLPGMLEDFVSFLRPSEDVLWAVAEEVVQKVKGLEADRRFRDVYESKARIHTWLAWQKEPGKPMGLAITARYLDGDAPYARELMAWIHKLFEI